MINMVKRNEKIARKYGYEIDVPLKLDLHKYQLACVNFAYKSIERCGSVIIADEQGLGKTVEALALTYKLKDRCNRVLVICPASARGEWKRIINDHTNSSYTIVYNRDALETRTRYLIINYDKLKSLLVNGLYKCFDTVIIDEFHNVKNRNTIRAKLLSRMKFKNNIYLSGTPILNRQEELWLVLNRIDPNEFGSYGQYVTRYSKKKSIRIVRYAHGRRIYQYITKFYGGKNTEELQKRIMPFFIRRRKKEVLRELPDKIYQNVYVDMVGVQRKLYDDMVKNLRVKIGNKTINANSAMAEFTRLRQICGTTATLFASRDNSASLDALEGFATDHLYGEHKFFVLAPFRTTAKCAYERLKKLKFRCVYIDGSVEGKEAANLRKKFQNDSKIKAYIGTIDANKEALTLTSADYAIFLGRSLVQKTNEQAEDRLHRIGQKRVVNIINIVNRNSVEEKIEDKILLPKARLFSELFDGVKSEHLSLTQIRKLL